MGKLINNELLLQKSTEIINVLKGLTVTEMQIILENCLKPINSRIKQLEGMAGELTNAIMSRFDEELK